jgi:hypothetical protein
MACKCNDNIISENTTVENINIDTDLVSEMCTCSGGSRSEGVGISYEDAIKKYGVINLDEKQSEYLIHRLKIATIRDVSNVHEHFRRQTYPKTFVLTKRSFKIASEQLLEYSDYFEVHMIHPRSFKFYKFANGFRFRIDSKNGFLDICARSDTKTSEPIK